MLTTGPAGHYFLVTAPSGRTDTTAIPMVTLDTLAADLPAPATHLKIDVDGFELEVLAGGRKLLRTSRPVVFLELHGDLLRARGQDPVKVFDELIQAG
jgi:FkbM family methyltransferase